MRTINHFGINNHQICRINPKLTINYSAGFDVNDWYQIRRRVDYECGEIKRQTLFLICWSFADSSWKITESARIVPV